MLANDVKRFEALKVKYDAAKTELAKMETLLEEKEKELVRVTAELKVLGIDPNNLAEQQKQLESNLAGSLSNLEQLLNKIDNLLKPKVESNGMDLTV